MSERPRIHSVWRHADGGLYVVEGFRNVKNEHTGEWFIGVLYDHFGGPKNPNGLGYTTSVRRWNDRFEQVTPPNVR